MYSSATRYLSCPCAPARLRERETWPRVDAIVYECPHAHVTVAALYAGDYAPGVTEVLASAGWGWHIETAIHVLRVILGGVFDRYPKLQFVIGHLGESLPSMMQRVDVMSAAAKLQRPVSAYLRDNVHYTLSGFNYQPSFLNLLLEVGVGRIMFSADYPYGSMKDARAFLEQLPVTAADRARIAHSNAEKLFRL